MQRAPRAEAAGAAGTDRLGDMLGLRGAFDDLPRRRVRPGARATLLKASWRSRSFGFLGGLFGLGAGWANVPALNLLMGIPLKLAAGTSGLVIATVNAPAAWIYFNEGAMLADHRRALADRRDAGRTRRRGAVPPGWPPPRSGNFVIVLLLFAGLRALSKGLGW